MCVTHVVHLEGGPGCCRLFVGGHGLFKGFLPVEGLAVCVNHCEVPVEGFECVADEGARFGAH